MSTIMSPLPAQTVSLSDTENVRDAMSGASISFADLGAHRLTLRALERLGIATPTPIQIQTIPPLLAGRDVIGQSRTGSGKTIAFGAPLVERVDPHLRRAQALVLVPTRELVTQVSDVLIALGAERGLRVAQLVGGRALGPQRQALFAGAQIVVGAPGRVRDHLRQGNLNLQDIRLVVLDEADEMLDEGFAQDIERILAETPAQRQLALFTATLPAWTVEIADRYLHEPVLVKIGQGEARAASSISQVIYATPRGQRLDALKALLNRRRGVTLVFGRTKHGVQKLADQLAAEGYPIAALQGNMRQNARDRVVADFRAGRISILIATNVAARGLDVSAIEQVINYELPESAELFTHRIGRTGRMDREGEAITLIAPEDILAWRKMQRDLGLKYQAPLPWPHETMSLLPDDLKPVVTMPVAIEPMETKPVEIKPVAGRAVEVQPSERLRRKRQSHTEFAAFAESAESAEPDTRPAPTRFTRERAAVAERPARRPSRRVERDFADEQPRSRHSDVAANPARRERAKSDWAERTGERSRSYGRVDDASAFDRRSDRRDRSRDDFPTRHSDYERGDTGERTASRGRSDAAPVGWEGRDRGERRDHGDRSVAAPGRRNERVARGERADERTAGRGRSVTTQRDGERTYERNSPRGSVAPSRRSDTRPKAAYGRGARRQGAGR